MTCIALIRLRRPHHGLVLNFLSVMNQLRAAMNLGEKKKFFELKNLDLKIFSGILRYFTYAFR